MAQRINNKNPPNTAPPTLSDVRLTPARQHKQWMCPICGDTFEQEFIKDLHMNSCKRRSHQQHVIADIPMKISQPIALNPGQNKGPVHFMSADKSVPVKSFEVLQHPTSNSNFDISMQENVAIPIAYTIRSPRLKSNPDTAPAHPLTFQNKHQDDDIYANVSQIADNIRMSHEVDQLKKRVTELENENSILKEENACSKNIIDGFHARRIELESELARLKNARGFENNLKTPPKLPLSKPLYSPHPDKPRT